MIRPTGTAVPDSEGPWKSAKICKYAPCYTASGLRLSYSLKQYAMPKFDMSEYGGDRMTWAR